MSAMDFPLALIIGGGSPFNPAAPGPIGGTTPAAGAFTTITATTTIQVGTGSGASTGLIFGNNANGNGGIWSTALTPDTGNYMLVGGAAFTQLNADGGGSVYFSINGSALMEMTATFLNTVGLVHSFSGDAGISRLAGGSLAIGNGTAGSFVGSLSLASVTLTAGTGAGRPIATGKLSINTTAVGNITTGEDVLQTYDLPLDSFNAANKGVHITAWGFTANNANAKTVKLYFGSVILTNALTISIAGVWRIEADVFSTGTDAQDYITQLVTTGTAGVALNDLEKGSLTENDGAAITIKCTGEAVDTNDIVQEGLLITFLN